MDGVAHKVSGARPDPLHARAPDGAFVAESCRRPVGPAASSGRDEQDIDLLQNGPGCEAVVAALMAGPACQGPNR